MADLTIAFGVDGTEAFSALARRLTLAADTLGEDIARAVDQSVGGLPEELRASAETTLPRRGGLDEDVARADIRVSTRSTGGEVVVEVTASSLMDLAEMDRGTVRHPLFGDRRHWYTETVRPGWWSHPIDAAKQRVEPELRQAMDTVIRRIEG